MTNNFKQNKIKADMIGQSLKESACFRNWEPDQKKGYDPNETRISDILECWAGETGPDLGIIGIPFDYAVLGRKGAKGGPKKIRDSIRYFKAYDWNEDFWFGNQRLYDFGDVIVEQKSIIEAHCKISDVISKFTSKGFTLIVMGGDHSITFPIVKGLKKVYNKGKIGLLNIDAHLDVREVINGQITSGTPFRRLLENEIINGKNFVEIGIRNFTNAKAYRTYIEKVGAKVFTMDDIRQRGINDILTETIEILTFQTDHTYLSIDMDSLDQIYAPGVSAPTPDGLHPFQVLNIIKRIVTETAVIGMDLVELNPKYDTADTTAINAANFLVQFVASYFHKKVKGDTCGNQ